VLEVIFYGIIYGSIISLGAIGLTLIFGILRFANFSHGDLMAAGAYVTFFLITGPLAWIGLPGEPFGTTSFSIRMIIAFPITLILIAGLSILIDQIVYKKLRKKGTSSILKAIAALGMSFIIRMLIYIIWGPDQMKYFTGARRIAIQLPFQIKVRQDELIIIIIVTVLVTVLHLFLKYSKMGKAMRATADNLDLARISGINTERIIILTWGIGGSLAAAAGILYGINVALNPEMGWGFLLPLFAATILGSIGNMYGALAGGLIIGIVQQVSTLFLKPTYKPAVAFVILILILLLKPQGIFGGKQS
jgi:branched-chain amino acid transport system permease protein